VIVAGQQKLGTLRQEEQEHGDQYAGNGTDGQEYPPGVVQERGRPVADISRYDYPRQRCGGDTKHNKR